MTIRRLLIAAVVLAAGANAFALSPQHEAWGKSAVIHLFTDEDAAAWKAIKTDEEAQAFIDLFWARRDPTPATPKNEFRERVEAMIRYADEKYTSARKKLPGSLTDRGMMLIVFGQPLRVAQQHAQQQLGDSGSAGRIGIGAPPAAGVGTADLSNVRSAVSNRLNSFQVWLYEGENVRQLFGVPRAEFTFVDRTNTEEYGLERGGPVDVAHWRKKVAASYITQPGLTRAPEFTSVPMGGASVGMPAAAAPVLTALTTPALASAVSEVKAATANPYANNAYAAYGEFITAEGEYFVPVQLFVPKASPAASASDLTFFGVIEDESGKPVLAFEQPAKLTASKEDFFVDKSIVLPAGKHKGYFGLASAGKTLALVPAEMTLSGSLDKSAAAVSSLILSNNIYPLAEPQRPTDPFAFGGTKVIPKSDKVFRASSDELWYFFEVRNPGLAEGGAPKIQVKVDITGTTAEGAPVKKSAPLAETQVMEVKGVAGHWAIGNAFPLTSFKPGDYTIAVKMIDTISKQTYTLSDKFKVVQ